MNQYIDSVLDTIDSIDAITTESDIATSCAMLGSYSKASLILEHYTGDDVSEFSIFKEAEELPEDIKKYNDEHHFARKKADGTDENIFFKILMFIPRIFTFIFKKIAGLFKKDGSDTAQMKADAEAAAKDPESGSILDKVLNLSEADLNAGTIAKVLGVAATAVGAGIVVKTRNAIDFKIKYGLSIDNKSVPFKVKSRFDYKKLTEIINTDIFGGSGILETLTNEVDDNLNDNSIEAIVKKCDEFKKKVDEFLSKSKTGSEEDQGTIAEIADAFIKAKADMHDKPEKLQNAEKKVSEAVKSLQKKEKDERPKNAGKLSDAMKEVGTRVDKLFTLFKHFNTAVGDLASVANTVNKIKRQGTDTSFSDRMYTATGRGSKTVTKAKTIAEEIIKLVEEHNPTPEDGSEPVDNAKAVEDKAKDLGERLKTAEEMADNAKEDSTKKRRLTIIAEEINKIVEHVVEKTSGKDGFSNIEVLIRGANPSEEAAEEIQKEVNETPAAGTPAAGTPENGAGAPKTAGGNGNTEEEEVDSHSLDTSVYDRIQYYIPDTPYYRNYW